MDTAKNKTETAAASAIGEVMSSTITNLIGETWNSNKDEKTKNANSIRPRFGSFIKVVCVGSDSEVFAVVYDVVTGPQDTIHKPSALGMSREELRLKQPHIFSLLKTELNATIIGFKDGQGNYFQALPPNAPEVHDFIYPASAKDVSALTGDFDFLRLLMDISKVPPDELIAATIREARNITGQGEDFLIRAGQALSKMLRSDYERLIYILRKIKPQESR